MKIHQRSQTYLSSNRPRRCCMGSYTSDTSSRVLACRQWCVVFHVLGCRLLNRQWLYTHPSLLPSFPLTQNPTYSYQCVDFQAEKYESGVFGSCPRVYCVGCNVVPCGRVDIPGNDTVKLFCPNCNDIYVPPSSRFQGVDG